MDTFLAILSIFLAGSACYFMVSTAGLFSEKSGTVNIALEGTMVMSLLTYAAISTTLIQSSNGIEMAIFPAQLIAMLSAMVVGVLWSMFLAFPTIKFMADHIIIGTSLNIIAPALAILIMTSGIGQDFISLSGIFGALGGESGNFRYISLGIFAVSIFILIGSWYVLHKTTFGLHLRASGENPHSLESSGVSVSKTRYQSLIIAGALAGLGGAFAAVSLPSTQYFGTVLGKGYIALAILIAGNWSIKGNVIWSMVFSLISAISVNYILIDPSQTIPVEFIEMIPFIIPIVALVFVKDSKSPTSVGIPYNKETH